MIRKFSFHISFTIFIFLSKHAQTITFIDISPFEFTKENKKGIRFTVFDVDKQEFSNIVYTSPPPSHLKNIVEPSFNYPGLTISFSFDGNISIQESPDINNYIIRTIGKIIDKTSTIKINPDNRGRSIFIPEIKPLNGEEVAKRLRVFSSSALHPPFQATFISPSTDIEKLLPEEKELLELGKTTPGVSTSIVKFIPMVTKDFSNLSSNKSENSDERGRLGELATEMTFISFGYEKLPSQNTSNQGFDGIFLSRMRSDLFLTESKCRKEKRDAESYMQQELDEGAIRLAVSKIPSQETREIVSNFIKISPDNIFKFVHRLKPNGKAQCLVKKFDSYLYGIYAQMELTISSPEEDKIGALRNITQKINGSPQEMFTLLSKVFNLSIEEGLHIMEMCSFSPTQPSMRDVPFSYSQLSSLSPLERVNIISPFNNSPFSTRSSSLISSMDEELTNQSLLFSSPTKDLSFDNLSISTSPTKGDGQSKLFKYYSYERLQKLVRLVCNKDNNMPNAVSKRALINYCLPNTNSKSKSTKPIRKLLGEKEGTVDKPEEIWKGLTRNFSNFCDQFKLSEKDIVRACVEDPAFQE